MKISINPGTRFGKITVIEEIIDKTKRRTFRCKCDCGNICYVLLQNLTKKDAVRSCGCVKYNEINIGEKYGRLTILKQIESKDGKRFVECKCDCGNTHITRLSQLRTKNRPVKSCGCLKHDNKSNLSHGLSNSRLYYIWDSMKQRCSNPKNCSYNRYGMRGITVCDEWKNDFMLFYNWAINNGYEHILTIERENNNGNYNSSNCKWVTSYQQARNRGTNIFIEFNGEKKILTDWALSLGITNHIMRKRLRNWPLEKALTEPKKLRCG